MNQGLSNFLNLSRWLAAFTVVAGHFRHTYCADLGSLAHPSVGVKALYLLTGFAHEAVMVFFVISGYLVGGGAMNQLRQGRFEWRRYLIARFSRIYAVLVPALMIGGILDRIGLEYFNDSGIYTAAPGQSRIGLPDSIIDAMTASAFFGSLVMLNGIVTRNFGSNVPLWSLAFEWWYYIVMMLFAILYRRRRARDVIVALIALVLMAGVLPTQGRMFSSFWILGAALSQLTLPAKWKKAFHPAAGLLLFLSVLSFVRLRHSANGIDAAESVWTSFGLDALVAIGYGFLLLSVRMGWPAWTRLKSAHARLADFSYTVYLIHAPILILGIVVINKLTRVDVFRSPNPSVLIIMLLMMLLTYALSYAVSLITEAKTDLFRNWLARNFSESPAGAKSLPRDQY